MTHEYETQTSDLPVQAIVPRDLLSLIPVTTNAEGQQVTDWNGLMVMGTDAELVAAFIGNELIEAQYSGDEEKLIGAKRLEAGIDRIIDLYNAGRLPTMKDVFELTSLIVERNPKMSEVTKYIKEHGYTAEGCAFLYDVKDTLGITLSQTDEIYRILGFSLDDEQDLNQLDDALEIIQERRELSFRHSGAEELLALIREGASLRDITTGRVF